MDANDNLSTGNHNTGGWRTQATLRLGVATALLACASCTAGRVDEPDLTGPTSGGAPMTSGAMEVSVHGIARSSDGNAIAGVSVCTWPSSQTDCTTSDAEGAWTLSRLPANRLVAITFVKEGFFPTLRPVVTATENVTLPGGDTSLLGPRDWAGVLVSVLEDPATPGGSMGTAIDPSVGHIAFSTATDGAAPTTPASVALGGPNVDEAPFFVDASGNFLDVTAGTRGLFVNLPSAIYTVTFQAPSGTCRADGGLYGPAIDVDGQSATRLAVPVAAGFVTLPVAVDCAPAGR